MDDRQVLNDIEQIKQLKARYIRFGDTKQWDEMAKILTEDFDAAFEGAPRFSKDQPTKAAISGRDAFIQAWAPALVGVTTVHLVLLPEITVTDATSATGIWMLHDQVWMPKCHYKGWGHYRDQYVKEDGMWKIRSSHVTRLHTEEVWL